MPSRSARSTSAARPGAGAAAARRTARLALLAAALALPAATPAGDQARALAARGHGDVLPLARLVQAVAQQLPGRLLEVEIDEEDGHLVYELTWLLPDGRRLEIELDARDGAWRALKGARLETAFRRAARSAP